MPAQHAPVLSYGRGQSFVHGEEITSFLLNNGQQVILTADNGGFLVSLYESEAATHLIDYEEHTSLHQAILATRHMAQQNSGATTTPDIDSFAPEEEVHSESLRGLTVILERSEAAEDRFWDVYVIRQSDNKTGDVQSFPEHQYLMALNAYDELFFEIEAENDPFESTDSQ